MFRFVAALAFAFTVPSLTHAEEDLNKSTLAPITFEARLAEVRASRLELQNLLREVSNLKAKLNEVRLSRNGIVLITMSVTFYNLWRTVGPFKTFRYYENLTPSFERSQAMLKAGDVYGPALFKSYFFGGMSLVAMGVPTFQIRDLRASLERKEAEFNAALDALVAIAES